jgi:hypothetical protein
MDLMMPLTAPPDAGAGSGKAASSKPSVADQLQDVDTSVLDRLNTIREEESRLSAFRTRASEMKGQVSDQVYRRVVDDYNKRATSLEQQATPLKTKGRAEYRKLHVLIGDVTRIRDQARLEKEELEFRHAVGELDDPDLRTGLEAPQGRLDQCEADLARIDEYSNRFIEAFGTKEALDAPEPVAPPPPPPPPRSNVTAKPAPSPAPVQPPIVAKPPAPPPADLDATAYMPASPSDTAPPLGLPPDLTMIVPDDATRMMPAGDLPQPAPPPEQVEGQTILVPMAALIAEPGSMPQSEYRLGAVNYLGRAEDNQVQIMSPEVSRKHAVITAVGSGFELKDLGSQNGVNVNGIRTNLRTLVDGDRVEIAGIALVFRSPWPARPSKVSGATGKAAAAKR